jgi:acyl-CoA dehydrogenase
VQIDLDEQTRSWQDKTRRFAEDELIPHEVEAEMNAGKLPAATVKRHKKRAIELGFSAMDVPASHGGLALRIVDQVAVWEQLGRVTNALCWCFSEPHEWMFEACNDDQLKQFVLPLMKGSRKECYAITEKESGSDVRIDTTAHRTDDGYRINGEKWYVTSANHADYFFLQAKLADGPHAGADALFFVDIESPGVEVIETPLFSHTFDAHHPTYRFADVAVPAENRLGEEGGGMAYSHSWFRRERIMIAARNCGAAALFIEEATEFAKTRIIDGGPLIEKQMIQSMLADCVTDYWAARLIWFESAGAHEVGDVVK